MNFLLTGGTGFVGFNLTKDILVNGHQVTLVSRKSTRTAQEIFELEKLGAKIIDCTEPNYLSNLAATIPKFDSVIHLAAHYSRKHITSEVRPMLDAAITLGAEMLEIAKIHGCRFLHAGSYLEYMKRDNLQQSLYVESKLAFERIANFYSEAESVKVTKMVFFDTYGPGDKRDKVLNKLIDARTSGKELVLNNPNQLIDLTHISDVVRGITQTVVSPWSNVVRISSGGFIKVGHLQELVLQSSKILGVDEISKNTLVNTFPALIFSTPQGWIPEVGLKRGLESLKNP